MYFEGTKLLK